MRPLIICDIDCTLYSYTEFIKTNILYPKESMLALFSIPTNKKHFPAVERTWKCFEKHIEDRISGLLDVTAPHGDLLFLSAFPDEDYKKATFTSLSLKMESSFPGKKIDFLKKKGELKVLLTIGDRPNDKGIAKAFQSKLSYLPIYKSIQTLSEKQYTDKLLLTIKDNLKS